MVRYRVLISGRVQGVFFRDACRRMAREHGVAGWVRNLPDGQVEAVFEGRPEELTAWWPGRAAVLPAPSWPMSRCRPSRPRA
jgi:acylphosphatase